jgi:hypothetical protein
MMMHVIRSPAAAAVLAGVNPVPGLYASFAGPIAGGSQLEYPADADTTT